MSALLIVHQGAIGDFILSLPALEALHRYYSQARFTFLARPRILELIRARPYVGHVFDCSSSRWSSLYQPGGRLAEADLKRLLPADAIVVFGRSPSQIMADNLAESFGKPALRIDPFPEPGLALRVIDYQCRQLEESGIPAAPHPAAVIAPLQQDLVEARTFVRSHLTPGDRLILLHPGSGSREKLWAIAGWLSLISKLAVYNNLRLLLLQGPADSPMVQQLQAELKDAPFILLDNWRLGKLAALITHAALYLGNDSGITHLAAACGTPTIALFGPTDPQVWAPQGPKVRVIRWLPHRGDILLAGAEKRSGLQAEARQVWKRAKECLGI